MRPSGRQLDQMRDVSFVRDFTMHAEGSVLVSFGNTKVLCTASVEDGVPRFLKGKGQGWITAEYGMLPRSTNERMDRESVKGRIGGRTHEYGMLPRSTHTRSGREAARGKQGGRTLEIQRLIGRSLRAAVDLKKLGENTIYLDCDVIQADGGTRTASISGACVALVDAFTTLLERKRIKEDPLNGLIASVSVGIYKGEPVLDLDYPEDSNADTDMNVVMTQHGGFVEIQGTAEGDEPFTRQQSDQLLGLAEKGIGEIVRKQQEVLGW